MTLLHAQLIDSEEVLCKLPTSNIKNKSDKAIDGIQLFQFTDIEAFKMKLRSWE